MYAGLQAFKGILRVIKTVHPVNRDDVSLCWSNFHEFVLLLLYRFDPPRPKQNDIFTIMFFSNTEGTTRVPVANKKSGGKIFHSNRCSSFVELNILRDFLLSKIGKRNIISNICSIGRRKKRLN